MNKKGFTLIEILAVIIILGILLLIVVPSVSSYIESTRKSSYVQTIKEILKSAGANLTKSQMKSANRNTTYYIPNECIKTENGVAKSPYGEFDKAYVVVAWENNQYRFYWVGRDESGVGVKDLKLIEEITESDIVSDIPSDYIKIDKKIGNTESINLLDPKDCSTLIEIDMLNDVNKQFIYIFLIDIDTYFTYNIIVRVEVFKYEIK